MSRTPSTEPSRIEPLATLPVFLKLTGKQALVIGDSEGALWKAELIKATGAIVTYKPDYVESDLEGKAIAIFDGEEEAAEVFFALSKKHGVPVNCVDKPALCDFSFGTIVNRSPLIVSISTDGAAPVLGQRVREKIETLLPQSLKTWALKAVEIRASMAKNLPFQERRAFWSKFTDLAFQNGSLDDLALTKPVGRVSLVGGGPGDPELLTLKAVQALQTADVILYDDLISDGVLEMARREAKRIAVGKRGHRPSCKQDEINALIVSEALKGQHVVRLKSGDPMVFGRAGEEIKACEDAGIAVTVVSGISAAQAASASLKMSLTHRDHAKRIQYVTGHAKDGQLPKDLSWEAIADPTTTTALYMPSKTIEAFKNKAIEMGLDPFTPALAITHVSLPNQAFVTSTIHELPEVMKKLDPKAPTLVMIGAVIGTINAENVKAVLLSVNCDA